MDFSLHRRFVFHIFLFFIFFFPCLRYEFSNKGADLFLESLARLNHLLKSSNSKTTVVAFLIFPTKTNSFNVDSLKGQCVYLCAYRGNIPDCKDLLDNKDNIKLKRCIYASQVCMYVCVCVQDLARS